MRVPNDIHTCQRIWTFTESYEIWWVVFKIPACDLRDSVGGDYSDLATGFHDSWVGFMIFWGANSYFDEGSDSNEWF